MKALAGLRPPLISSAAVDESKAHEAWKPTCKKIRRRWNMKLRTKLLLATSATALAVLGVSEWIGYWETMDFLRSHTLEMGQSSASTDSLPQFQDQIEGFAKQLAIIHATHAALEVAALVLVLSLFWNRMVLKPIRGILNQMNRLGHSERFDPISLDREDEIGEMTIEINRLGVQLAGQLRQVAAESEFVTLARLGQNLVRRVSVANEQVAAALTMISVAHRRGEPPPELAVRSLQSVWDRLATIPNQLETEFDKRLDQRRSEAAHSSIVGSSNAVITPH
jgi:methyl-accepting chemotaxis protein